MVGIVRACLPVQCEYDCQQSPTPSPSASVEPSSTPEPMVEPSTTPEPSPEVSTEPSPTATTSAEPQGFSSPQGPFDAPSSSCTAPVDAPILTGFKANADGTFTISWWKSNSANVDSQSVVWGYSPTALVYGANNLSKDLNSFTVGGMITSGNHWFQVWAYSNGCAVRSNVIDP